MKKIEEETCYSCKNKSNIREVLFQLQVVCEDLKTVMNRLVQIEHVQRLSFTTMNGIDSEEKL